MKRSFEAVLVGCCAPTLDGLKPASLFHWSGDAQSPARWARIFPAYGLRLTTLKRCPDGGCLLYLYRVHALDKLLSASDNAAFLRESGYQPEEGASAMLRRLSQRLRADGDFPHEIGVFLGYPLEDVRGFMENGGRNYTCCGCWKAYGDAEAARRRFDSYRRCTEVYRKNLRMGVALERLITA